MKAWHFLREDGRCGNGQLGEIKAGETYKVTGEIVLCHRGLHASVKLIDALNYAPGPVLCRVEMGGEIIKSDDKVVASERTVIWMQDISETLHKFVCDEAYRALVKRREQGSEPDERSWNAIRVKRLWLQGKATDSELAAAYDAARAAAYDAARAAAYDAARDAACYAAYDVARDAACYAARAAARDAVRAAAWSAARDAVRAAAWGAAYDAARAAAWAAAWAAARDAQNKRLTARANRLMKSGGGNV